MVNEFNFGMRHDSEGFVPSTGMIEGLTRSALNFTAPQLFPDNNRLNLVPTITGWSSVVGNPANINWLDRWGEVGNDYIKPSFSDNFSVIHGTHNFKFGVYSNACSIERRPAAASGRAGWISAPARQMASPPRPVIPASPMRMRCSEISTLTLNHSIAISLTVKFGCCSGMHKMNGK